MINQDRDFELSVAIPKKRPLFYLAAIVIWIVLLMCVALLGYYLYWETPATVAGYSFSSVGKVLLTVDILLIVASIKWLDTDEVGALVFWGLPIIVLKRGPKLIPFGIFQLKRFPGVYVQTQFPDNPEFIQKTDDKEPLETVRVTTPDGKVIERTKVRPIRITTGGPKKELGDEDILNVQMTVEFTFWVRWIIVDPLLLIVNTSGDVEEALRQMRDTGESLLNAEVTKKTPSELLSQFKEIGQALHKAIADAVKGWGILVTSADLTSPDLNHEVASELRNIAKAKANAKQVRVTADATAYNLEKEGIGKGRARQAELAGEGRGYRDAAKAANLSTREMLQAQIARDTVGEGDLILGTEGISSALGIGTALLSKVQPDKKTSTDQA